MDTRRIPTSNVPKAVTIYVPFLGTNPEEVTLRVQTVCRDDLIMSPDTLAFGQVKKGQGAKVSTKVTFTSDPRWAVTESTSTGGFVQVAHKLESRQGNTVTYEVTAYLDKDCPAGQDLVCTDKKCAKADGSRGLCIDPFNRNVVEYRQGRTQPEQIGLAVRARVAVGRRVPDVLERE